MPRNPGKFDRRITIQAHTTSQGVAGGVVEAWADLDTIWAEKIEEGTREFRVAAALRSEITRAFRIRWRSDVTAQHRISFDGRLHDIVGEPIEEGRREFLLLPCKFTEGRT